MLVNKGNGSARVRVIITVALTQRTSDEQSVKFPTSEAIELISNLADLSHTEMASLLMWFRELEKDSTFPQPISRELTIDLAGLVQDVETASQQRRLFTSVIWAMLDWPATCELGDLFGLLRNIGNDSADEEQTDASDEEGESSASANDDSAADSSDEGEKKNPFPIGFQVPGSANAETSASSSPTGESTPFPFGFC